MAPEKALDAFAMVYSEAGRWKDAEELEFQVLQNHKACFWPGTFVHIIQHV